MLGRKELHTPHFVCESSVHQLHILLPAEKAASNGHVCPTNHVIMDSPANGWPSYKSKQVREGQKIKKKQQEKTTF